jgi:hypothetical protein
MRSQFATLGANVPAFINLEVNAPAFINILTSMFQHLLVTKQ